MDTKIVFWNIVCFIVVIFCVFFTNSTQIGRASTRYSKYKAGDHIEIVCTIYLNASGMRNSSHLRFLDDSTRPVDPKEIHILNETSILMTIKNAKPMYQRYTCMLGDDGVDMVTVQVGTIPKEITDFQCIYYYFEYFTCNFTAPQNNVTVNYSLSFTIKEQIYNCELKRSVNVSTCNITRESGYRQVYPFYNFTLKSENELGEVSQDFLIDHFANLLVSAPEYLRTIEQSRSVLLQWNFKNVMTEYVKGFQFEIKIKSQYDKEFTTLRENIDFKVNNSERNYFTNLTVKYPHTEYEVILRAKARLARDDLWSDISIKSFTTLATKPDEPPATDTGSFFIDSSNNIHLYWKSLPKYKANGEKLRYEVVDVIKDGVKIKTNPIYDESLLTVKFIGLTPGRYEFKIKSRNKIGYSDAASDINVSNIDIFKKHSEKGPLRLKSVFSAGIYNISWSAPHNSADLTNYTIFWCKRKSTSSKLCEDSFDFAHVLSDALSYTLETSYQEVKFFVSANYLNDSSGMQEIMCTPPQDSEFIKLSPLVAKITSTNLELQWPLTCEQSSLLEGYYLEFCPIGDPQSDFDCKGPKESKRIPGDVNSYNLTDLKPNTTYKITMSMFSFSKKGPSSEPVLKTTLEDAPSPPSMLTAEDITNTSVVLKWNPPEHMNGQLNYYEIIYNNGKKKLEATSEIVNSTRITYNLDMLSSYCSYKIYVRAVGFKPSDPSNDISIQTDIGTPGSIELPKAIKDGPQLVIYWERPEVPSGELNYYEFQTKIAIDEKILQTKVTKIVGNKCRLAELVCQGDSHRYEFSVRAVNVIWLPRMEKHLAHSKRETEVKTSPMDPMFELHDAMKIDEKENSAILKRGSNMTIGSSYHVHKLRHSRSKKEVSESDNVPFPEGVFIPDCMDETETNFKINKLFSNSQTHLHGAWSTPSIHFCYYNSGNDTRAFMILGIIFAVAFMCGMMYSGSLKYRRMKSIDIILPLGLTDLDQETRSKGVDNMYVKEDIARSAEWLFNTEEDQPLPSRLDPRFFRPIPCLDKSQETANSNHIRGEENSGHTDSVEMSDMSESSNSSLIDSPAITLRQKSAPIIKMVHEPLVINGYVQHQHFQKPIPPPSYDYTQLDAFGKPIIPYMNPVDMETKHKDTSQTNGVGENICGYVTHKQLSDFGHRLQ